jgi:uncharacterized membrane protein YfcA
MPDAITFLGTDIALDGALLALWAIVFIAGVIRGFTGFGSALIAVPALAFLYGPAAAVVIEVLIEIPVVLYLLPAAVRQAHRPTVLPMIAMFLVCVPVGAGFLTLIDPQPMKIILSVIVLIAVALLLKQSRLANIMTPRRTLIAGGLAGLSQGLTAIASPIFAVAMMARNDDATTTRANIILLAGALILLSLTSYIVVGLLTLSAVAHAVLAAPALILGVITGTHLFKRFAHLNLRPVFLTLITAIALATLVQALT